MATGTPSAALARCSICGFHWPTRGTMPHCKVSHASSNKLQAANKVAKATRHATRQPLRRLRSVRGAEALGAESVEDTKMSQQAVGSWQRAQRVQRDEVLQRLAGPLRGQAAINLAQAYRVARA
jgi:hypothetical protein